MLSAAVSVVAPALALDLLLGDPVSRWHPVAIFGRGVERLLCLAPKGGARRQIAFGVVIVAGATAGTALAAALLLRAAEGIAPVAGAVLGVVLLKVTLAFRQLEKEVLGVRADLEANAQDRARSGLRTLVARDTQGLPVGLLSSAAIESLAENLSDSFVAPLFYWVLFGVPGAMAYRAINTLDAMVGYHGQLEYLGRAAAKADDWANWVPARLTAVLIGLGAGLAGGSTRGALAVGAREHGRTESPNAGWPMATIAGALRVRLEKVGHYALGTSFREPTPEAIREAVQITRWAAGVAAAMAVAVAAL